MSTASTSSYTSSTSSSPYWSERGGHRTSGDSETSPVSATYHTTHLPIASRFSPISNTFLSHRNHEHVVEHLDTDANWYRKYFYGKEHPTFVGNIEPYGPIILSLALDSVTENRNGGIYWYRYIFRKRELPDERGILSGPEMPPFSDPPWEDLLKMISKDICDKRLIRFITTPELGEELLNFDETRLRKKYKVGVLYCAANQSSEEEWFSNSSTSKAFDNFLSILGTRVKLLGFDGFKGGLDTRTNGTGEYSIYDKGTWKDFEIMYHVSTMLPYDKVDKNQIIRKRHIGNDVSCIVFQDVASPFFPTSIKSKFLHVFIIVSPVQLDDGRQGHRVKIVCKDSVPYFGPPLPDPPVFEDPIQLKKFLVAAAINGQNAAWKTAELSEPTLKARHGIIEDIVHRLLPSPRYYIGNGGNNRISPETTPKKLSRDELDHKLKSLFTEQLKQGGPPPDIVQVQTLLKQGANPNVKISQQKPTKSRPSHRRNNSSISSLKFHDRSFSSSTVSSATSNSSLTVNRGYNHNHNHNYGNNYNYGHNRDHSYNDNNNNGSNHNNDHSNSNNDVYNNAHKLPNILFATIAMCDDPAYAKFLIYSGAETMPKDVHYPNAFVFAARHKRVEIMRCLLESVPSLGDPESVDVAIDERIVNHSNKNHFYGNRIWHSFTGEVRKLKEQITGR